MRIALVSVFMRFQFRAEFFNLLNNVNFTVQGLGSASPNESAAGNVVGTGNFGRLTADPRIFQFALKFRSRYRNDRNGRPAAPGFSHFGVTCTWVPHWRNRRR
jgi:hypothetical protein